MIIKSILRNINPKDKWQKHSFFAQMCDQFNLKRNYAKSYDGLLTRLASKLFAMSILHWLNHLNGRKLAQIKHALSF